MTTEPGAQPQPFEAPQMAASTEQQQTQPGATPAALQVQILATEHWSLLATCSQSWNESFARAQMFLSALAASVIALALVAQATGFGERVHRLCPSAAAGGAVPRPDHLHPAGGHQPRRDPLGPGDEPDPGRLSGAGPRAGAVVHHQPPRRRAGAMVTAGWGTFPTLFGYVTTPAAVGVIDAVVAGVIVLLATRALGLKPSGGGARRAGRCRVGSGLTAYSRWAYRRWREIYPPVSPTPETVH